MIFPTPFMWAENKKFFLKKREYSAEVFKRASQVPFLPVYQLASISKA